MFSGFYLEQGGLESFFFKVKMRFLCNAVILGVGALERLLHVVQFMIKS